MLTPRQPAGTLRLQIACLLLAAAAAPAGSAAQVSGPSATVRVSGVVVDAQSEAVLPQVRISLVRTDLTAGDVALWTGITDSTGTFLSGPIPAGPAELRVEALGFAALAQELDLTGSPSFEVRVELTPEPLGVAPLVVVTERSARLEAAGFYERRLHRQGYSLTREEIDTRYYARPSDLFRTIPGIQLAQQRQGLAPLLRYRGCFPVLVLDGVPLQGIVAPDDVISMEHIEAVEVHSGPVFPVPARAGTCGTVLVWTRDPSQMRGGAPQSWKRILVATAFVGVSLLFLR